MRRPLCALALSGMLVVCVSARADSSSQAALAAFGYPEWNCDRYPSPSGRPGSDADRAEMQRQVQAFKACTDAWSKATLTAESRLWALPAFNAMSTDAKKAWKAGTNEPRERTRWYAKTRAFSMAAALALEDWIEPPTEAGLSKADLDLEFAKVALYFRDGCPIVPLTADPPRPEERDRVLRAAEVIRECRAANTRKWSQFKVHQVMSEGRWNLMSQERLDRYHAFIDNRRRMAVHLQNSELDQLRRTLSTFGLNPDPQAASSLR